MINVNEVKQYIEFLSRKSQSGGVFTPNEFNLVLPKVVFDIVRKYYGVPEEYQFGNPEPRIAADNTQLVRDYLSQLKPVVMLPVNNGFVNLPSDYIHKSSARVRDLFNHGTDEEQLLKEECDCTGDCSCRNDVGTPTLPKKPTPIVVERYYPIAFMSDEQFNWAMNSIKRYPTKEYPIARMQPNQIEIAPRDISAVELSYYRYPVKPVWGYTLQSGLATYDPATSTNIELPDICGTEVVLAMLNKLGISIREQQVINWSERTRQQGS
jgi:hypothetical protein